MTGLDSTISERIDRFYNRLLKSYEYRMEAARDKNYAHNQFLTWAKANSVVIKELNEDYNHFCSILDESYKLGKPLLPAIKKFRMQYEPGIEGFYQMDGELDRFLHGFDSVEDENEGTINLGKSKKQLHELSDFQLACLFADQKAKDQFYEFLNSNEPIEKSNEPDRKNENYRENTEKNKDFTTSRQVLAIHFLMKYIHVRDTDKSEIARFVQFLTGKNYDNIYKKVLSPYSHNNKTFKQDLRFVREYFEKLNLQELVRMINNEIECEV